MPDLHTIAIDLMPMAAMQEAAESLKVLAHPVRMRMVDILMQGEFAVHEIASLCQLSHHQTCEHLRLLKGHHLLDSVRRGRSVFYKIIAPQLPGILMCLRNSYTMKANTRLSPEIRTLR